jgi:hypothetical protein
MNNYIRDIGKVSHQYESFENGFSGGSSDLKQNRIQDIEMVSLHCEFANEKEERFYYLFHNRIDRI